MNESRKWTTRTYTDRTTERSGNPFGCLAPFIVMVVALAGAWLTHVVVTIQNQEWLLLVAGAIFFPVGIVHGIGVWFGAF